MPAFLISETLSAKEAAALAARVRRLDSSIRIEVGLPEDLAGYQRAPRDTPEDVGGGLLAVRCQDWGEPREGWIEIEVPDCGLLLAGEPSTPAADRAARAEQLAAELDDDPDLRDLIEVKRAARAAAKEVERG